MNTAKQRKQLIYYLILSIMGEALILAAVFFSSQDMHGNINTNNIGISDKIIVGSVFILICVFGLFSAVKPNSIKRFAGGFAERFSELFAGDLKKPQNQTITVKRQGHHPECGHFKSHTFKIKNKIFCAGCFGLAAGAVISVFFMVYYIITPTEISSKGLVFFVLPGMALVALNYIKILLPIKKPLFHVISNILLVAGFFFVSAGVFQLTGSVVFGLFSIAVSVLWLDTRIQLSEWRHSVLCEKCSEKCKAY